MSVDWSSNTGTKWEINLRLSIQQLSKVSYQNCNFDKRFTNVLGTFMPLHPLQEVLSLWALRRPSEVFLHCWVMNQKRNYKVFFFFHAPTGALYIYLSLLVFFLILNHISDMGIYELYKMYLQSSEGEGERWREKRSYDLFSFIYVIKTPLIWASWQLRLISLPCQLKCSAILFKLLTAC